MKKRILVTRKLPGPAVEQMSEEFEVVLNPHDRDLGYDELLGMAAGCAGLLSMLSNRIDEAFMAANPGLKVVSNYAVGYNNIDLHAARKHGIVVTNTPGVLTETTADLAWALIMAVSRRVVEADRYTREGLFTGWAPEMFLGRDVFGKTLGIVGMGRIGLAVARRASGFDMRVIYYSRSASPEAENELGAERIKNLDSLVSKADFISLHIPLAPETHHLIDSRRLALMKSTAFLINTARGPVVDEEALAKALAGGSIAGAGFDVYEEEPRLHPRLAELPNTVLLPHIGSASTETRIRMAQIAADNLAAVLRGETPAHPVPLPC
ncbi:MAG: D-glycerate dehydrogenase [Gemmatimonadota bacterium]|nr:D-glycerate dehydrogenase [Gemmatimonadota bacterium]